MAKKLFFIFEIASILAVAIISSVVLFFETENALNALIEIISTYLVLYFLSLVFTLFVGPSFQRETKLLAIIFPGIMNAIGISLSFWLYWEYLGGRIGVISFIITILTATIIPLGSIFLDKILEMKQWKIYLLSLLQIIISALVYFLVFYLLF